MAVLFLLPLVIAQNPAGLRLQYYAGEEAVYRLTMGRMVTQKGAEQRPFTTRSLYDVRRTVVRPTANGGVVRYRFERLIQDVSGSGKDGRVDTAETPQKGEPAELAILRKVVGRQFEAEQDPQGKLLRFDALGRGRSAADGLAESTMRVFLQAMNGWMPEALQPGETESWKKTDQTSVGGLTLIRNTVWRLQQGQSSSVVGVSGLVEFTHRPGSPTTAGGKSVLGTVLKGPPSTAAVRFDLARGILVSLETDVSLEMRVDAFAGDAKTPTESVLQTLAGATKLEIVSPAPAAGIKAN